MSKFEIQRLNIGKLVKFRKSLEHFDAGLDHFGFRRLGSEPIDKGFGVRPLSFFVGAGFFVNLVFEDDLRVGFGRAARKLADFLAMDNRGVRRDAVHKVAIVGDQDKLAFEVRQESRDPTNRGDVEIVGRFVEQKEIGLGEQEFRKVDTDLKAAGELPGRFAEIGLQKIPGRIGRLQPCRWNGILLPAVPKPLPPRSSAL